MSDTEKKEILEQEKDLETNELDEVAGGVKCFCVYGGGGPKNSETGDKTCACVMGGGGENSKSGARCVCIFSGGGD